MCNSSLFKKFSNIFSYLFVTQNEHYLKLLTGIVIQKTDFQSVHFFYYFRGESAFHAMMSNFGWAKFPMCNRISALQKDVPLTMIYGSRSWVDHSPSEIIKNIRGDSYVDIQLSPMVSLFILFQHVPVSVESSRNFFRLKQLSFLVSVLTRFSFRKPNQWFIYSVHLTWERESLKYIY